MTDSEVTEFTGIPIDALRADALTDFAVFVKSRSGFALFRKPGQELGPAEIQQLKLAGVDTLYVRTDDRERLGQYYVENLDQVLGDPSLPKNQKAEILHASSSFLAREIMDRPNSVHVNRSRPVVVATVQQVLNIPEMLMELIKATGVSYSMHAHMVNCGIFSMAICIALGVKDPEELNTLTLAAFLHDLGKAQIPYQILHKEGELTSAEWGLMRQHPLLGYNILQSIADMPEEISQAARSHHERIDGGGYPDGQSGNAIPFSARVTAVVDVFGALTSSTPYRQKMSSYDAIMMMRDKLKGQFDPEILKALVLSLGRRNPAA